MQINSGYTAQDIFFQDGGRVRLLHYPIGAWNMKTTVQKEVALTGITDYTKIVGMTIHILSDTGLYHYKDICSLMGGPIAELSVYFGGLLGVAYLERRDGGFFTQDSFQSVLINRGDLIVIAQV